MEVRVEWRKGQDGSGWREIALKCGGEMAVERQRGGGGRGGEWRGVKGNESGEERC